jgi:dTDP-4-dehydrorhamnose reductase
MKPIQTVEELEESLSRPTLGVLKTLEAIDGDVMILGAAGKMGPTLSRMVRRALDTIGQRKRRVFAISRFSSKETRHSLEQHGVETYVCDLLSSKDIQSLPSAPNVLFLAGQKFGTSDAPDLTWAMNTLVPSYVAERYRDSRIVAFSTGCVYPLLPADGPGAKEEDMLGPPGDYANSCVGRERVFSFFSKKFKTPVLLFRLCYAIELRYGVLSDIANRIMFGSPVDVSMGVVNVIWQGDANARAIESLAYTTSPPTALNVTGLERVSVRALATRFGELMNRQPVFVGEESDKAWVWDANRSYQLFGEPIVSLDEMMIAVSEWTLAGGPLLGKPTHFEVTSGEY